MKPGCYTLPVLSDLPRRSAHASDPAGAAAGSDGDAKIEQLLLLGLDHYFAAQYERAITVWTRALFLDRNHARVRAYIERARSALAEQQRQSEEMLQTGVAAAQRGDAVEARRLVQAAIDGGAPLDEALTVLDRLHHTSSAGEESGEPVMVVPASRPRRVVTESAVTLVGEEPSRRSWTRFTLGAIAAVALVGAAVYAIVSMAPESSIARPFLTAPAASAASAPIPQDVSLPIPKRGAMALERGRALVVTGHLHEALNALENVRATDPEKAEAERLRALVQRQLLALTPMPPPVAVPERRLP